MQSVDCISIMKFLFLTNKLCVNQADEACALASEYNVRPLTVSNLCQSVKAEIAQLKVLSDQFYNFLFNLIAALTKIVRNTIAKNMSGPLQSAENGIDLTMLTIGSLMVEMKYQTSAQARSVKVFKPHQINLYVVIFRLPIVEKIITVSNIS